MLEILKIGILKVISSFSNLIAFTVMVSVIDKDKFSIYLIIMAIFNILNSFIEANEYTLVRAIAVSRSQRYKYNTMMSYEYYRYIFYVLYLIIFFIYIFLEDDPNEKIIILLVGVSTLLNMLIGDRNNKLIILNKQIRYSTVNNILALSNLGSICLALLFEKTLEIYLSLNIIMMILIYIQMHEIKIVRSNEFKRRSPQYFDDMSIFLLTSIVSAIKKNFLFVLIGVNDQNEILVVFSFFKRYYDYFHKGIGGLIDQMYVRLSKFEDKNKKELLIRIFVTTIIRLLIAISIYLILNEYMVKYLSYENKIVESVGVVLLINFFLNYFITIATTYASKYNAKLILWNSILTASCLIVLPYFFKKFTADYSEIYALVTTTIISIALFCMPTFFCTNNRKLNYICIPFSLISILFIVKI